VGSETFPAGRYSVALIGPVSLELRNSEGHTLTSVLTQSVHPGLARGRLHGPADPPVEISQCCCPEAFRTRPNCRGGQFALDT
jgi:hypothetical protein